jgi:NhaP-type Na+/H+ or K+/H+ antiporter
MIALDPTQYRLVLALAGFAFVLAAWAPAYTKRRPLSLPMVLVSAGAVAFALPGLPDVDPREHLALTEHLTEFGVIIALLGAGLKLDRPIGLHRWGTTWRLLGVSMLLTIAGTAVLGWAVAGLAPATALLLGAILAPTDPVLAADVQVGEPSVDRPPDDHKDDETDDSTDASSTAENGDENGNDHEAEDDVRFSLTSEAGLNDGLAFPFVYAAIAMVAHRSAGDWVGSWFLADVVGRVAIGVAVGWAIGKLLGRLSFDPPGRLIALSDAQDGFVALAVTFIAYGVAELAHGYGFLAVFTAAVALRDSERGHSYHRVLHDFAGQVEQLVVVGLLILLGGAAATGLLSDLTWSGALIGLALIFVIRPLSGHLGLIGSRTTKRERRAISFFGIRGVGSIYYLAFAVERAEFEQADEVWAIATFTILASIVIHGVTATPVMEYLDRRRARRLGHTDSAPDSLRTHLRDRSAHDQM